MSSASWRTAQLIQHDQVPSAPRTLQTVQTPVLLGCNQLIHQTGGRVKPNALPRTAGCYTQGNRQVRLPCASVANHQDVFTLANPFAVGQGQHFAFV